jgi:hypothetical protein
VTDVTTYWYGRWTEIGESVHVQVTTPDLNDTDSAMILSWENVSIPANGFASRTVIAKFGP